MKKEFYILNLEDNESDSELVKHELKREGIIFNLKRIETKQNFLKELNKKLPDIILADYSLPSFSGIEALRILKKKKIEVPFILVTGTQSEEVAVNCMKEGADDYILKSSLRRLPAALMNAMKSHFARSEKKRMEDELKKKEEYYRLITENAQDLIAIIGKDYKFSFVSPSFKNKLGYNINELIGKNPLQIVHPDDRQNVSKCFYEGKTKKSVKKLELRLKVKNDGWRFFEAMGKWIFDKNGNPEKLVKVMRDISERKKSEEALKKSMEQYRQLFDSNPHPMWIYDKFTLSFLDVNNACVKHYGYSKDDFSRMNISDLLPNKYRKNVYNIISTGKKETDVSGEWKHRKKDGTEILVEIDSQPISFFKENASLSIVKDITLNRFAEIALKESQEKYRSLVELSPDGIYIQNEGKIVFVNPAGVILFGAKNENELLGKHVMDIIHPDYHEIEKRRIAKLIEGNPVPSIEEKYIKVNSEEIEVEVVATPFNFPDSPSVQVIVRDIRERKRAEKKLKKSFEQLRRLSEHLETVREEERIEISREIHDELGQLLTGLKIDIVMLERKLPGKNGQLRERTSEMVRIVDSVINSVKRISSELRPGVLDELGLFEGIEWQAKVFEKRTGIYCRVSIDNKRISFSQKSSFAIFRIIQEALTNIARHSEATEVDIIISTTNEGKMIFKIIDNGRGIKDEEIAQMKSLGILGMKERAIICSGNLKIKGEPEKGTCLTLTVDIKENKK